MGNTYSAPDIYHRIRGGRGASAFSSNGAMTEQQSGLQSQINQQVSDLNNKMNASWTGNASDKAVSVAAPLATASDSASTSLNQASDAMHNQVSSFHTAYNSVVPMSNAAPQNNFVNEFVSGLGVNTPLDQQITNYNAAGQQNVQVYNNYSTQSSTNAAEMPTDFGALPNPHPEVTIIPGPTGSSSPSYTGSVGPGGTGGGTPSSGYSPPGGPRAGGGPVWTNPGEPVPVGSPGGPGPGGGVWEPPPTTIQSAPPNMDFPPSGGVPPGEFTDPNFPPGMGPYGGLPPNEESSTGGRGTFNPLTGEWTSGEPGFGGSGGFGGAGGPGGSGGVGTGTSGGAGSSGTSGASG